MMQRLLRNSIWLLVLSLGACASSPDPASLRALYPPTQYLVGQAGADNREVAAERARAELAKVFSVEIAEVSIDRQSSELRTESGTRTEYSDWVTRRSIASFSSGWLEGARIVANDADGDGGYRATAVLQRSQAARGMRADIQRLDAGIGADVQAAEQDGDRLRALNALLRALDAQQQRDAIERRLRVVEVGGGGIRPVISSARLDARIRDTLAGLQVRVEAGADAVGGAQQGLADALGALGVKVGAQGGLVMLAEVERIDLGQRDGWQYLRAVVGVRARQAEDGRPRGYHSWTVKASGRDRASAEIRLRNAVRESMTGEVRNALSVFGGIGRP